MLVKDIYNLDSHLASHIAKSLEMFKAYEVNFPQDYTYRQWKTALELMIIGFNNYDKLVNEPIEPITNTEELEETFDIALDIFKAEFKELWI